MSAGPAQDDRVYSMTWFASISLRKLARLTYDGRHQVGELLARTLKDTAKISVGSHHSEAYELQVAMLSPRTCE